MHDLSPLKQIPIVDVAKQLGIAVHGTKAMCFMGHDKASPSLSFLKSRNTWRCFGACGKHGDAIALVMEKENLDFKSALTWFALNFGVDVWLADDKQPAHQPVAATVAIPPLPQVETEFAADSELYAWLLNECPIVFSAKGIDYLARHGISLEFANSFGVRELPEPKSLLLRLIEKWGEPRVYKSGVAWGSDAKPEQLIWKATGLLFPFFQSDSVIYMQARMLEGSRKYLNLRGIAKPLFNTDRLSRLSAESLIHLCEGAPDALAMEAHGMFAVGVLGATSFRPEWVDQFLKFTVEVMVQGDAAGEKFAASISNLFRTSGKTVRCKQLPKGKDVADILAAGEQL
jgi:DNA primase